MSRTNPIRTLLVDDNRNFLASEALFLSTDPEVSVVGQATSGEEAISMAQELHPDLVLLDLAMPRMDGFATASQMKQFSAAPRIVIVSLHDDAEYQKRVQNNGLSGFVSKRDLVTKLLPLVKLLFEEQPREPEQLIT